MFNFQTSAYSSPLSLILTGSGLLLAVAGSIALATAASYRRNSLEYKVKKGVGTLQKEFHRIERSIANLH